jgi:hypothetical protein
MRYDQHGTALLVSDLLSLCVADTRYVQHPANLRDEPPIALVQQEVVAGDIVMDDALEEREGRKARPV